MPIKYLILKSHIVNQLTVSVLCLIRSSFVGSHCPYNKTQSAHLTWGPLFTALSQCIPTLLSPLFLPPGPLHVLFSLPGTFPIFTYNHYFPSPLCPTHLSSCKQQINFFGTVLPDYYALSQHICAFPPQHFGIQYLLCMHDAVCGSVRFPLEGKLDDSKEHIYCSKSCTWRSTRHKVRTPHVFVECILKINKYEQRLISSYFYHL